MNKAVSRNVKSVDFDAQSAAREAARREGKSLGEWLHGVIADHAAEFGVGAGDMAGQERVDAVTSRLERLSSRVMGQSQRVSKAGPAEPRTAQRLSDEARFDELTPRGRRLTAPADDADALLDDAIEQMDRRAARNERRTEEALANVAKMMETGEARRVKESEAVATLTRKLTSLETKLTEQFTSNDNPVKGALARLEARLELIGKRNAAEAEARAKAVLVERPASNDGDAVRRLEDKLNHILRAVEVRSTQPMAETSHIALRAAQKPETSAARRSLGEAITEISQRQQLLEDPAWVRRDRDQARERVSRASVSPPRRTEIARDLRHPSADLDMSDPVLPVASGRSQDGIADLIARVDEIRRNLAASREMRQSTRSSELDDVRGEIATMSQTLRELGSRPPVTSAEASLQRLAARLDRPAERTESGESSTASYLATNRRPELDDHETRQQIGSLEKEVRAVAEKLDGLRSAGIDRSTAEMLQDQMQDLVEAAVALRATITTAPGAMALEKIEQRLELLAGKVDEALVQTPVAVNLPEPKLDTSVLEGLVRELGHKIEAAQAPSADTFAMEALQHQVEQLSERFSRSEQGLSTLPTLAASVRELFNQLETTRASVETSAAHAAREVLRIAADDGRNRPSASNAAHEITALKALQTDGEQRTESTLNAVHHMLEKVVDRLSHVESDLADVRRQPAPIAPATAPVQVQRPAAQRPLAPKAMKPAEPSKPHDLSFAGMETARDPIVPLAATKRDARAVDLDDGSQRNDFIAAARRAAKNAQAEPAVAALKLPPGTSVEEKASRAQIFAKSRDYVATQKRPILMGLAAILMVLGTIAVIQRMGLGGRQDIAADDPQPRIGVVRPSESAPPASRASLASNELSPSALPRASVPLAAAIPGSDPIQTGSIPSLPAFAAQGAPSPTPARQGLPSGLKIAAEAGNGDAQYELGSRYSEGRAIPRDMKLAAQWLEKAADQGLPPAQYRLASLYEKGIGVGQDKAKAKSLYLQSAEAGNPRAMHNLAVMLADGDGHPDYAGAAVWFRKAANFGVHDSQYNLAILLARGLGVQQSLVQSYQWFAVAAAKNDPDAAHKRDEVGGKMNPNDLAVAKALAAAYQPKIPAAAVLEIDPPPGGWDSAPSSSRLNSAKSKISSL